MGNKPIMAPERASSVPEKVHEVAPSIAKLQERVAQLEKILQEKREKLAKANKEIAAQREFLEKYSDQAVREQAIAQAEAAKQDPKFKDNKDLDTSIQKLKNFDAGKYNDAILIMTEETEALASEVDQAYEALEKAKEPLNQYNLERANEKSNTVRRIHGMFAADGSLRQDLPRTKPMDTIESAVILLGLGYGVYKIIKSFGSGDGGGINKKSMAMGVAAFSLASLGAYNKTHHGQTHTLDLIRNLPGVSEKRAIERTFQETGISGWIGEMNAHMRVKGEGTGTEGNPKSLDQVLKEKQSAGSGFDHFTPEELKDMVGPEYASKISGLSMESQRKYFQAMLKVRDLCLRVDEANVARGLARYNIFFDPTIQDVTNYSVGFVGSTAEGVKDFATGKNPENWMQS